MGETNEKERDPVSYYIKEIRKSNAHDDVSTELYWALECKGDPPYSKWVATWILKCIRECFENKVEADILLASFALLPGYYLAGHTLKDRLWQYIDNSDYLTIYPSESGCRIEDIHDKKEINRIEEKIQKKERACVEELIVYIKDIINPATHIEELNEYGHKEMLSNKKIAFKPDPEHIKLSYPKQKDNNLQPTGDTDPHSKSGQDEETSSLEDSAGEEVTARIALRQDNQTIETPQSDNIESENTIGNRVSLDPQRDIDARKPTDESKHSLNKKWFFCIAIVMIIALLIFAPKITITNNITNNYPTREPYKKPDLPEVEFLQATEDTIRIKAGEKHFVKIDVEPFEALDLLQCYSSNVQLVAVSNNGGVVQAATDWPEDTVPETDIYIHAKNMIEEIHVIVYK